MNNYKFTGQERDSESNLDHFPARYYSSQLGRFMTPDPLGIFSADLTDPQTLNQYSYVRNNPLSMIDPTGTDGIGIGCDDYTCDGCFILCDVGISWGGGSSGPTSVWVPPDTAGTSSPGGSSTGGPDPNDPFSGETFGIPNGMNIPLRNLAGILLPEDTGCDFGGCGGGGFIGCGSGGCPTFSTQIDYLHWLLLLLGPNAFIDQRILPPGMTPNVPPNAASCSRYHDGTSGGTGLYQLCMKFPDKPWSNCVRGKLLNQHQPSPSPFQLMWYLGADHVADFATCKVDQPVE